MKSIKAHLQQRKPIGGLLGTELAQLTKAATAKSVTEPSEELMQAVTSAVNSSSEATAAQQMRDVLHKRLTAKNPHKVWLATVLTDKVLQDCSEIIQPVRSDLYQDLADIAGKPLDRYQENFKDEQRAKMHAFGVLRGGGRQAQGILRHTCKIGRMVSLTPMPEEKSRRRAKRDEAPASQPASRTNSATGMSTAHAGGEQDGSKAGKMSWEQVKEAVNTSLGVAASHTQMIQDLVLNITSGKSAAPDFERQFLGELVEEVLSFRSAFEQLLASVSSFKQDTKPLVKQSLEAIEEMNNVLELYRKQVAEQGSSNTHSAPLRPASPSGTARATSSAGARATSAAGSASAPRSRSGPLDSLITLGEVLPAKSGRRDKERVGRINSNVSSTVSRSTSGRSESSNSHVQQTNRDLPASSGPSSPNQQQSLPPSPLSRTQTSFTQTPSPTYMAQPSVFPQQQMHVQQQPQGPSNPMWAQPTGSGSHAMPGFIPMQHTMLGHPGGAAPLLYMPVMGPDCQQGFAPVFQPQHQSATAFTPSGAAAQQAPLQHQQSGQGLQQPFGGTHKATTPSLPFAADANANPFGPEDRTWQQTPNSMGVTSAAVPALQSGVETNSESGGLPKLPAVVQRPLPYVRRPAAVSAIDPFASVCQLEAPYTPAAVAASSTMHHATDGTASAFAHDSDAQSFSSANLAPLSHSFTEGREASVPPPRGNIPHSISASSDIFPAESANGVLASTGLPNFGTSQDGLPAKPSSPGEWKPHFPSTRAVNAISAQEGVSTLSTNADVANQLLA